MSGAKQITVTRDYRPAPDDCTRALQVLLGRSVLKKAVEPTPEPDSRDDAKESNGCIATQNHSR